MRIFSDFLMSDNLILRRYLRKGTCMNIDGGEYDYNFMDADVCDSDKVCEYIKDYELEKNPFKLEANTDDENNAIPFYRSKNDPFSLYNFTCNEKGEKYVADEISNDYMQWLYNPMGLNSNPIFITAQTGKRKTTFVVETLLRYLQKKINNVVLGIETPYKVLILSNRIALNVQIKDGIINKLNLNDTRRLDTELTNQNEFGFITILSYQGLRSKISPYLSKKFTHVIFDECHFFTSDSIFNPETGVILKAITTKFSSAVRIYMSATMDDCIRYVCDYELLAMGWKGEFRKEFMNSNAISFKRYKLKQDYSYLNIKWFYCYSDLSEIIKESPEKWLVFIDSIRRGEEFKNNQLNSISDEVMIVNSGSKEEKEFLNMLKSAKLPNEKKVLIATSVIDNGVSFDNNALECEREHLKNVVVEELDRVKCLQLVGRIRPRENERITLYIKVPDKSEIQKKINSFRRIEDAYKAYYNELIIGGKPRNYKIYSFYRDYYDIKKPYLSDATQLFYRTISEPERVRPNAIAESMVEVYLDRYSSILGEIKKFGHGFKYLEYQYSWFDHSFSERDDPILTAFWDFIETLPDTITIKERATFKKNFEILYLEGYEPKKKISKGGYSMKTINDVLKRLNAGMQIEMSSDKRTWRIIRAQNK